MNFSPLTSFLTYSRSQRTGLFILLMIVVGLQLAYTFVDFTTSEESSPDERSWLALQAQTDSLKVQQAHIVPKIYPFNPNFITDFKGYKLGMSVAEIDRLLAFRKQNKYVNSAAEFQTVTKVSDSLLRTISPYFKFPTWVRNSSRKFTVNDFEKFQRIVRTDINKASKEELIKVYGIGDALSERILKFRAQLGGFVSMTQMEDVWGLSPEVIENLNKRFIVESVPTLQKIPVNSASLKELMQFPYFRYSLAKEIITYRSMNGSISGVEDLTKIKSIPVEKIDLIALYLEF